MSSEEEDLMSKFFDWLSLLDCPIDELFRDLISDANINPCSPIVPFTSLHQYQPPSSPKCNLSDTTTTISLSTSTCLSLFAKLITDRSDLESESIELQKLGDEAQLVCLKLSIMKKHVRVTKLSTNEKLDLRLDCFQILQTARSPLQPQAQQNGGSIENGSNVISTCQSHSAIVLSKIEDTGESSKIKSRKKK
ncbi:hypothetical protein LOK49_LG07G03213 [Camellia lanceoleosa]|uniref:Uncharacterized protein n=1 Tax=Camellia lanceoleosa TaxID=1840588 RepID=A0ACC0GZT2_9ERIC|nr:hypothetical protein LOK49_LG07G03213 [Camellia lanceoleosa]